MLLSVLVLMCCVKHYHTLEEDDITVELEDDALMHSHELLDFEQLEPVQYQGLHVKAKKRNRYFKNHQMFMSTKPNLKPIKELTFQVSQLTKGQPITVVVVACETKLEQTLNLIKSALIFTKRQLHFVILTDEYITEISEELEYLSGSLYDKRLIFTVKKMAPLAIHSGYMSEKFRKCGAQKLFIPSLLPQSKLALYVETASLFLGPVEELWSAFDKFSDSQMAAMSRDPRVNAVSILMDLQRMRRFGWENYIAQITDMWRLHVNLTGQDIMDIIFNHHERAVMHLPCKYNYPTHFCDAEYRCPDTRSKRFLLLHSSQNDKDPTFEVVSKIVRDFLIGVHAKAVLSYNLKINAGYSSPCISMITSFLSTPSYEFPIITKHATEKNNIDPMQIVVSFVVCDTRLAESLNLVKSVLFFTSQPIHFVVFAEENLKSDLKHQMSILQGKTLLTFEIYDISIPEEAKTEWMELFSKCSSLKLFIPELLPHVESVLYVDTDTVFLGPVEEVWEHLSRFNRLQIAGMAVDHFDLHPEFAKNTRYWNFGVNSGVMLMNLTKLRAFDWSNYVTFILPRGNLSSSWGDQVVVNTIFNEYPVGVYELPCRYNYRVEHCVYGDNCPSAAEGVLILHGGRGVFHRDVNHAFTAIYKAMDEYTFGTDKKLFLAKMKLYLDKVPIWYCRNMTKKFLRSPTEFLSRKPELRPITVKPHLDFFTKLPVFENIVSEKSPVEFINEPVLKESVLRKQNENLIKDDIVWN